MQGSLPDVNSLSAAALDGLLPLHLVLAGDGTITGQGPTLGRLLNGQRLVGQKLFDAFDLRRPPGITDMAELLSQAGKKLHLALRASQGSITFRGLVVPFEQGKGALVNLSFGLGVVDAVRTYDLREADFAPTDLAVEMMYLVEANTAITGALRGLARRMEDDKLMAEAEAMTDTLTGLRNRRALSQSLERLMQVGRPLGLMHIDLDYFKTVNDTLGHAAGDHVLRQVALVLQRETRLEDTAARVGGDEFVLVCPDVTEPSRLEAMARRIIEQVSKPIDFEGRPCRISASIGIAMSTQYDMADAARMQSDADEALYEAKRDGRGRAQDHGWTGPARRSA